MTVNTDWIHDTGITHWPLELDRREEVREPLGKIWVFFADNVNAVTNMSIDLQNVHTRLKKLSGDALQIMIQSVLSYNNEEYTLKKWLENIVDISLWNEDEKKLLTWVLYWTPKDAFEKYQSRLMQVQ